MGKYRKHESAFKLKLVNAHQRGASIHTLSTKWAVSTSQIRKWIDHYKTAGLSGLLRKSNQEYSKEFKLKVIQSYLEKGLSLRDCCLHYQIPSIGIVSSWVKIHKHLGDDGLTAQQKGRKIMKGNKPQKKTEKALTRLEELEKENLYLKAENELLKKLEALTQKKEAPQKKQR